MGGCYVVGVARKKHHIKLERPVLLRKEDCHERISEKRIVTHKTLLTPFALLRGKSESLSALSAA